MSSPYDQLVEPKPEEAPVKKPARKRLFRSKTFWVNLFAGAGSVIAAITNSEMLADNPEVAAYGATGLAVVNLILRFMTKEPVKL
ncbi:MAG: hypothetical protein ACYSW8_21550 [Planctomycetota bacterium]|jgi:hypothetical protein